MASGPRPDAVSPEAASPEVVGIATRLSVEAVLHEAAMGRAGVDRPLIRSILEFGDAALPEVLRFAAAPREHHRLEIDPLLIDLLRHFRRSPESPHADAALACFD